MKNKNAQAFCNFAEIRRALILARYYRQRDQVAREASLLRVTLSPDMTMPFVEYDGHYGFLARCLRISARNGLQLIEQRAGISYMLGFNVLLISGLSEKPFREWPEYQTLFHVDDDLWSNPIR